MAKVSVEVGMTLQVRERDYFKLTLGVQEIDTDLPVEQQLALAGKSMAVVYEALSATIAQRLTESTGMKLVPA